MAKVIRISLLMMLGCFNIPSEAQQPNKDKQLYIFSTDVISEGMEDQYLQSRSALLGQIFSTGYKHYHQIEHFDTTLLSY